MDDQAPGDRAAPEGGMPLAELSERVTRSLQAGDPVEIADFLGRHPDCAGPIQSLLPTLRGLADLGRSIPPARPARKPRPPSPTPSKARDQ